MSINNEYKMAEEFLRNLPTWLRGYRLVAREWYVQEGRSHKGKGDLVFLSDDQRKFLVVELKYLDPRPCRTAQSRRCHARKLAKEQVERYGKAWAAKHLGQRVDTCAYFGGEEPPEIWTVQEESPWQYKAQDESPGTSRKVQEESSGTHGWGFLDLVIGLLWVAAAFVLADYNQWKEEEK